MYTHHSIMYSALYIVEWCVCIALYHVYMYMYVYVKSTNVYMYWSLVYCTYVNIYI